MWNNIYGSFNQGWGAVAGGFGSLEPEPLEKNNQEPEPLEKSQEP